MGRNLYSKTQEPLNDASTSCWTPDLNSLKLHSLFQWTKNEFSASVLVFREFHFIRFFSRSRCIASSFLGRYSWPFFDKKYFSVPKSVSFDTHVGSSPFQNWVPSVITIFYSPLIQGTRLYNEISFQGSPILFSPMSNTSCLRNFFCRDVDVLMVRAGLRAQNSLESVVLDSESCQGNISRGSQHVTVSNLPIRSQCRNCRCDWVIFSRVCN